MKSASFGEWTGRHKKSLSVAAVVVLGLGALEADGYRNNLVYSLPQKSCTSPFAVSRSYIDTNAHTLLQTQTGIDTTGITATGQLPRGSFGVQAAFENPDAHGTDWHTSKMVKADATGQYALKLAIGNGWVEFGVRIVSAEGTVACETTPDTTFHHYGTGDYAQVDGQQPWPNLVSRIVDTAERIAS